MVQLACREILDAARHVCCASANMSDPAEKCSGALDTCMMRSHIRAFAYAFGWQPCGYGVEGRHIYFRPKITRVTSLVLLMVCCMHLSD